jgi:hypothetical protein
MSSFKNLFTLRPLRLRGEIFPIFFHRRDTEFAEIGQSINRKPFFLCVLCASAVRIFLTSPTLCAFAPLREITMFTAETPSSQSSENVLIKPFFSAFSAPPR